MTAGLALAMVAVGAFRVLRPVIAVARGAEARSLSGLLLRDACVWFTIGVTIDALAVTLGAWRWVDVAGLAVLVGGLAGAVLGALTYLGPMLRGADPKVRNLLRTRVEAAPRARAGAVRAGVLLLVLAAALGPVVGASGAVLAKVGWGAFLGSVLAQIGLFAWPLRNTRIRA